MCDRSRRQKDACVCPMRYLFLGLKVFDTYFLTYLLTYSKSRVILEKLTGFPLVKKFPAFCATPKFITTFTSAHHLSLFWASSIQSIPSHPTYWRSILLLSSHLRLGLPGGLFPSVLPTKTLYMPLLSTIRATCSAHLILNFIIRTLLGEQYRSLSSSLCILRFALHTKSVRPAEICYAVRTLPQLLLVWPNRTIQTGGGV